MLVRYAVDSNGSFVAFCLPLHLPTSSSNLPISLQSSSRPVTAHVLTSFRTKDDRTIIFRSNVFSYVYFSSEIPIGKPTPNKAFPSKEFNLPLRLFFLSITRFTSLQDSHIHSYICASSLFNAPRPHSIIIIDPNDLFELHITTYFFRYKPYLSLTPSESKTKTKTTTQT